MSDSIHNAILRLLAALFGLYGLVGLVEAVEADRKLNNAMRELQLQERDEERRILYELSAQIGEHAVEFKYGVENLAMLDLIFAKAKYAEELKASEPVLHKAEGGKQRDESGKLALSKVEVKKEVISEQSSVDSGKSSIENRKLC